MLPIKKIKTIDFIDALEELRHIECDELNIPRRDSGCSYNLPDGRPNIKERLWKELIGEPQHGNQIFSNDSLFIVHLDDEYIQSTDLLKLRELCKHAFNEDSTVVFDVCW